MFSPNIKKFLKLFFIYPSLHIYHFNILGVFDWFFFLGGPYFSKVYYGTFCFPFFFLTTTFFKFLLYPMSDLMLYSKHLWRWSVSWPVDQLREGRSREFEREWEQINVSTIEPWDLRVNMPLALAFLHSISEYIDVLPLALMGISFGQQVDSR